MTLFSFFLQFQPVSTSVRRQNACVRTLFSNFSLQFQNVSNTVTMYNLPSLFSLSPAVPNRLKYRQNACIRDIVFIHFFCSFKPFQQQSGVRMHALETLFSNFSRQFQIVSNTVTIYALETLLLKICLQYQIVSECIIYPCSSKWFQISSSGMHAFKRDFIW